MRWRKGVMTRLLPCSGCTGGMWRPYHTPHGGGIVQESERDDQTHSGAANGDGRWVSTAERFSARALSGRDLGHERWFSTTQEEEQRAQNTSRNGVVASARLH